MRAVETAVVDHFYGGAMIKDVVRACVASDTITDIRAFMQQHSEEFDQSSLDGGTEHRLEYTVIHSDYCRLIESHLSAALERHGKTLQACSTVAICSTGSLMQVDCDRVYCTTARRTSTPRADGSRSRVPPSLRKACCPSSTCCWLLQTTCCSRSSCSGTLRSESTSCTFSAGCRPTCSGASADAVDGWLGC